MALPFHARLHVLLARNAEVGVILRRGPSKAVCSIGWDLKTDQFEVGQWLRGRIYERRSDLSPDGRYMIYFAMNGKWDSKTGGSWTAISHTPWLKATVLYSKGDCWHGGGLFTGKRSYWLNGVRAHRPMLSSSLIDRDMDYRPQASYGGEDPGVYYLRLQRDGWDLVERKTTSPRSEQTIFEKMLPKGWLLRKLAHEQLGAPPGKGCYWDEHELVHPKSGRRIEAPDWEWTELRGASLLWVEKGRLYRAALGGSDAFQRPVLLKDFNEMKFKAIKAPY
jgi:hypothetical protein